MAGYEESPGMPLPRHKAILKGLEALAEAQLQNPVLSRLCQRKMLPQRLRDRWQSLGFQDHAPTDAPADTAEDRRRQRLEAMRQRQQAMMQRMQQKQKDAVEGLAMEGETYDDAGAEEACVAKVKTVPWLESHVEKCGKRALGREADAAAFGGGREGALALLRSACAELVTCVALAPQALADVGPPPPLFATLLQDAAVLRYDTEDPVPQTTEENWQAKIFQRLAKPPEPWLSDLRAALAELVLASLKDGLSPTTFSEYVMLLLQVQTCQARSTLAAGEGAEEEPHMFVQKQQMEFLVFASWLATAIWRFSPQERNRLAYLEMTSEDSLTQLAHWLRLPGLALDQVPQGLPASLQVFSKGELADASMESFIELPEHYLDLLKEVRKRTCSKCQTAPEEPALCLLCGAIVCVGNQACRGGDREGPCTAHARACTAGQSFFLLPYMAMILAVSAPDCCLWDCPYMAMILAVSAPDCCLWDCPYVDKNGEPNPRLRRPCAMNFRLDARRWETLRQIFVKSTVRREIFLYNEKMGQYIPEAL